MNTRIGVDIGGTFSDLVCFDAETGHLDVAKGPSTPAAPHEAVRHVIEGSAAVGLADRATLFLHGSTVALNALLERKGADVGLLTTRGFRDVLELRRGERVAMNDIRWRAPEPLIPRRSRLEVGERVLVDGTVETPLDEDDVREAVAAFAAQGVTCIAVVFVNAYVRPDHEVAAEAALRRFGFDGEIVLSHRVSGEYREYERTSTAVIDAYVRPRTSSYLELLETSLRDLRFGGDCLITTSGGGALRFTEAAKRPSETIQSGPVAGAVAAGDLCRQLSIPLAVAADVGGTSFDACLVLDGRPDVRFEGQVVGMPIQAPWVDVRSIGAGGGSIGYVDGGGRLRVGPESAGADPGPACYGRGGSRPTVTDSAFVLGMLGEGLLAGGLELDGDAAARALEAVAGPLGVGVDDAAVGIVTIAGSNMANTIREITLERGHDPRELALIAYGGAGPLFATLLAEELEIEAIVVPPFAGNFSAWGLLCQDIVRSRARTVAVPLSREGIAATGSVLAELLAVVNEDRVASDVSLESAAAIEAALDLRFAGQEYTLTVPVAFDGAAIGFDEDAIRDEFISQYRRTYGHSMDEPVEIVSARISLRTPLPRLEPAAWSANGAGAASRDRPVSAYSFRARTRLDFSVLSRSELAPGSTVAGPAIVTEPTATTYVDDGFSIDVHPSGALLISTER